MSATSTASVTSSSAYPSATTQTSAVTQRVEAIDAIRGLIIVLMVVDHARDYANGPRLADPMELVTTPTLVFWMRWAAHFCAPVFTLLAGVSAGMQAPSAGTTRHLLTRGAVLIALEFTVVAFAWTFSFVWPLMYAQVIWGLGVAFVVLALLKPLPGSARLAIGVVCVAGHNLLDGWHPISPPVLHWIWAILHDRQVMPLWDGMDVRTSYPVLPMIGLMLLGDALGNWYRDTPTGRARPLAAGGAACLVLVIVLRLSNVYGDPHPALYSHNLTDSVFSFLNVTKYPMSLSFMLLTCGPALLVLSAWDRSPPLRLGRLVILGRVPMFMYVAHLYLLHAIAIVWALVAGYRWSDFDFRARIGGLPVDFGFPVWLTPIFAVATVIALFPAARWYDRLRASRRYPITRYV